MSLPRVETEENGCGADGRKTILQGQNKSCIAFSGHPKTAKDTGLLSQAGLSIKLEKQIVAVCFFETRINRGSFHDI
jgi:hypothetical protein